jgi:hypothetical protein
MPEDCSDTIDDHSSVQIPRVLFEYQYINVDTTSGWTGVTSEHTTEAQSYTQGSSDYQDHSITLENLYNMLLMVFACFASQVLESGAQRFFTHCCAHGWAISRIPVDYNIVLGRPKKG